MDMAVGFWGLLIPHGLQGGALSHIPSARQDGDGDDRMGGVEDGWQEEHTQWWFEFLESKKLKGVSKDVWQMVRLPDTVAPALLMRAPCTVLRVRPHDRLQIREVRC